MSTECQFREWLSGKSHECGTCGMGPCVQSFRIPLLGVDEQTGPMPSHVLESGQSSAESRGLVDVKLVADVVVGGRRNAVFQGSLGPHAKNGRSRPIPTGEAA